MRRPAAGRVDTGSRILHTVGAVDGRAHPRTALSPSPHLLPRQLRDLLPTNGGQAMSTDTDSLYEEMVAEFTTAALARLRARFQLERRDSPENRDAWRAAGEEVDAVLDCWLEAKGDCE